MCFFFREREGGRETACNCIRSAGNDGGRQRRESAVCALMRYTDRGCCSATNSSNSLQPSFVLTAMRPWCFPSKHTSPLIVLVRNRLPLVTLDVLPSSIDMSGCVRCKFATATEISTSKSTCFAGLVRQRQCASADVSIQSSTTGIV